MIRPLMLVALVSLAAPALAQRGAARRLGDPSGATSVEPGYVEAAERPVYAEHAEPEADVPPAPSGEEASSTELAMRSRILDATFLSLGSRGGPSWTSVVLSMVSGSAAIGFGIAFLEAGPPYSDLSPYFVVLGSTTIVRTIVCDLILRPDARAAAIPYQNMSASTPAARAARVAFGESQLHALSDWSLAARVVDASLNIAGALAVIPAYLLPKDLSRFNALEAFVFVGPAIALIAGIVTLATPSEAEQRWDAYQRMRRRLRGEDAWIRSGSQFHLQVAAAPLPGGGAVVASGRF